MNEVGLTILRQPSADFSDHGLYGVNLTGQHHWLTLNCGRGTTPPEQRKQNIADAIVTKVKENPSLQGISLQAVPLAIVDNELESLVGQLPGDWAIVIKKTNQTALVTLYNRRLLQLTDTAESTTAALNQQVINTPTADNFLATRFTSMFDEAAEFTVINLNRNVAQAPLVNDAHELTRLLLPETNTMMVGVINTDVPHASLQSKMKNARNNITWDHRRDVQLSTNTDAVLFSNTRTIDLIKQNMGVASIAGNTVTAKLPPNFVQQLSGYCQQRQYQVLESHENNYKIGKTAENSCGFKGEPWRITATKVVNSVPTYVDMLRLAILQFPVPPMYLFAPNPEEKRKMLLAIQELRLENVPHEIVITEDINEFNQHVQRIKEQSQKNRIPDEVELDDRILSDQPLHAKEYFFGQNPPPPVPNYYFLQVFPDIEITADKVKLKAGNLSFQEKTVEVTDDARQFYDEETARTRNIYLGIIDLDFSNGKRQPLPALSCEDDLLRIQSNVDLKIEYCPEQGLHYVSPKNPADYDKKAQVRFVIKAGESCQPLNRSTLPAINPALKVLFSGLRFAADGSFINNNNYRELLARKDVDPQQFQRDLALFCQHFEAIEKDNKPPRGGNERLNWFLQNQTGACRHRAMLYKAIAEGFGLPAKVTYNKLHAFVQMPDNTGRYHGVDLGGAPTKVRLEKLHLEKKVFQQHRPDPTPTPQQPPLATPTFQELLSRLSLWSSQRETQAPQNPQESRTLLREMISSVSSPRA